MPLTLVRLSPLACKYHMAFKKPTGIFPPMVSLYGFAMSCYAIPKGTCMRSMWIQTESKQNLKLPSNVILKVSCRVDYGSLLLHLPNTYQSGNTLRRYRRWQNKDTVQLSCYVSKICHGTALKLRATLHVDKPPDETLQFSDHISPLS